MTQARVHPLEIDVDPEHWAELQNHFGPVQQQQNARHDARLAAHQNAVQQENRLSSGAVVVSVLTTLAGITVTVLAALGFGPPYRGRAFRNSSAKLRDDDASSLRPAQPSSLNWAGVTADEYAGWVRQQQRRRAEIASAYLTVAEVLETQADQIEQGRQETMAILGALIGAITSAVILQKQWQAAVAAGSPAAIGYERALLAFGIVVASAVVGGIIAVLIAAEAAGTSTAQALEKVIEQYQGVGDVVAAPVAIANSQL